MNTPPKPKSQSRRDRIFDAVDKTLAFVLKVFFS
jgi:hypothetical protein